MKIQLDYNRKEITLENNANLKELFDIIKASIPDWKEWTMTTNSSIIWNPAPIIINQPYRTNPWWEVWPSYPIVKYETGTPNHIDFTVSNTGSGIPTDGIYQLEYLD